MVGTSNPINRFLSHGHWKIGLTFSIMGFMLDQCWVKSLFLYSEWLKLAYFVGGYSLSLFLTHVFCLALDRCDPDFSAAKNGQCSGEKMAETTGIHRAAVKPSLVDPGEKLLVAVRHGRWILGCLDPKLRGNWDKTYSFGIWACHDNVVRNHRKLKGHSALGHGS